MVLWTLYTRNLHVNWRSLEEDEEENYQKDDADDVKIVTMLICVKKSVISK
jgi:hypothetical protein